MVNIEEFTIFTKYYSFFKYYLDRVEHFPRVSKFTIGDRIVTILCDIQEEIIESIYIKDRYKILKKINLDLEKLRIYTRISSEKQYISIKQHEYIAKEVNEIGKMIGGWLNLCKG